MWMKNIRNGQNNKNFEKKMSLNTSLIQMRNILVKVNINAKYKSCYVLLQGKCIVLYNVYYMLSCLTCINGPD